MKIEIMDQSTPKREKVEKLEGMHKQYIRTYTFTLF
jgi:hypothetical protein